MAPAGLRPGHDPALGADPRGRPRPPPPLAARERGGRAAPVDPVPGAVRRPALRASVPSRAQRAASRAARAVRRRPTLAPGRGRRLLFPPAVWALPGGDRERPAQPAAASPAAAAGAQDSSTTASRRPGRWPTAPSACSWRPRPCARLRLGCAGDPGTHGTCDLGARPRLAVAARRPARARPGRLAHGQCPALWRRAGRSGPRLRPERTQPDRIPGAEHQPPRHPSSASEPAMDRPARRLPA